MGIWIWYRVCGVEFELRFFPWRCQISRMDERVLAVIGGGPAGLAAAEAAALEGVSVCIHDAMRSVGRKFLVAGKSGLNLTHGEPVERFATRYHSTVEPDPPWIQLLENTSPSDVREWAAALGVETFQARTGRVYPTAMKAAPLLRRWIDRLRSMGVTFKMNHAWRSIAGGPPWKLDFSNGDHEIAHSVVFAMGGGSWPQTGSDGSWMAHFETHGLPCHPMQPANCGWETCWPESVLAAAEGMPIKNIEVHAGKRKIAGELLITRYGMEGGAIYQLGHELRAMNRPLIEIDFKPTFSQAELLQKLGSPTANWMAHAKRAWRLSSAAVALLEAQPCNDAISLAKLTKKFPIELTAPRPLAEAISSAGGLCWSALDASMMIRTMPGCFVAGEMIDWEAPTGGYLLQGCMATGRHAGRAAAAWMQGASL